ncbi:class I SAM-dependent methyltransferase [Candidatus Pelagibacter bacterium nBUS_29]|uniref:class I SAM-dependent methyltransferase n=1 Tax=Candidatus Pelagibacter bacterium nBUS_29 TaxID=3374190 RepID=UPI003EBD40D6
MNCRHCKKTLKHIFLDLGFAPPSNAYLNKNDLKKQEIYFPLKVYVCKYCWLVQTEDYTNAEALFTSDYAYFSSTSTGWLNHAKNYADKIIKELSLDKDSLVIEIASNDGYLLKNFLVKNIPCLGIEPTASTAKVAEKLGIPVLRSFFGKNLSRQLAYKGKKADLIIGNNVYAHVPDINDFTKGLKEILKSKGTITIEFPHIMRMIEGAQFDTIYHEHFSYLSLHTVNRIFKKSGLRIYNVEELPTHGGSLRIYGCHNNDTRKTEKLVERILKEEKKQGLQKLTTYLNFKPRAEKIKNDLVEFLIKQKNKNKKVVAYGAAAKGNTLLNYAGIKKDLISCVYDAAKAKQGRFMPGSHIPILPPNQLYRSRADYILILPWNIASEIIKKNIIKKKIKQNL